MKCSICQSTENRVVRTVDRDGEIRRRRRCTPCGHEWTTRETAEAQDDRTKAVLEKAREIADLLMER